MDDGVCCMHKIMMILLLIPFATAATFIAAPSARPPPFRPRLGAAVPGPLPPPNTAGGSAGRPKALSAADGAFDGWTSLSDGASAPFAARKRVLREGSGDRPEAGAEVEIDYVGTLAGVGAGVADWTARDAVEAWLGTQQGVPEGVAEAFVEKGVDGRALSDGTFTDEFIADALGVANKMQCKKLVVAARRLAKQVEEFAEGDSEFDSSAGRGPFKFAVGKGRAIRCMDLAVATMRNGERAEVVCRCDYAYGKEGLRRVDGTVTVPPYATLRFEIELLKC